MSGRGNPGARRGRQEKRHKKAKPVEVQPIPDLGDPDDLARRLLDSAGVVVSPGAEIVADITCRAYRRALALYARALGDGITGDEARELASLTKEISKNVERLKALKPKDEEDEWVRPSLG